MSKPRILNVGCGNDMFGTDRIDIVKTTTTKVCNIEYGLPFPDETFDLVYCSYVWEHMKNPHNLLEEMKRVCKRKGKVQIITDNASYIYTHMEWLGRLHGNYSDSAVHPNKPNSEDRHYALYTLEHLDNFFESVGIRTLHKRLFLWENISKKSKFVHFITRVLLGKRFGMPSIMIIGERPL